MQRQMQKWIDWIESLTRAGKFKAGDPLQEVGKVLSGPGGKLVTDGPFAETKEVVGGYLLVTAKGLEEATELARGCPIFQGGGTVEVRPIRDMNMPHQHR
jgi:hypothetical protein